MALYEAYNCKHMIDLAPSPLKLAYKVVASGGTYVGLCATTFMANHLDTQLNADLMNGIVDKNEKYLYDPRFSTESPGKDDNATADTPDAEHAEGADTAHAKAKAKGKAKAKAKAKAGGTDSAEGASGEVEPSTGGVGALDLDKLLSEARQNVTSTEQET